LAYGAALPLTPAFGHAAAPTVSPDRRFAVFVHTYEEQDCLAIVDTEGAHWPQKLVSGADFYMQPCWHPQGRRLAWVAWNHPQMPWEGSHLQIGTVCDDASGLPYVADIQTLAGSESIGIFQPTFSSDGRFLAYVSNQTGWDNLYLYDLEAGSHRALLSEPCTDIGQPAWAQGMRTYGFRHDSRVLYYLPNAQGVRRLWSYDLAANIATEHHTGLEAYTFLDQPALAPMHPRLACIASAATLPPRIITLDLDSPHHARVCRRSTSESVPPQELSAPHRVTWSAARGERIHGLFYPPQSLRFQGRGQPPALILIHGGPTSQAVTSYQANVQFFTTRGFTVLQVNHRGSTGYGKAYVDALRGQWGIVDVEDAVTGAQYLVQQGWADATKLVIMGGSAGGYTVLQALVHHPGFFKAGVCLYGISNLFTLAASTHKFEAHYLDSLIGPLPEAAERYRERSPLFAAERIRDPIALFQGDIDQVVPKDQADAIVASLARRRVPHEYHVYVGEGHGFRKTATIAQFYTSVEAFLRQYVLFA
jgi:dipeptidyl aminopeptidase/acylaminoacyl peptidase